MLRREWNEEEEAFLRENYLKYSARKRLLRFSVGLSMTQRLVSKIEFQKSTV